jgi:hypothetical protein
MPYPKRHGAAVPTDWRRAGYPLNTKQKNIHPVSDKKKFIEKITSLKVTNSIGN